MSTVSINEAAHLLGVSPDTVRRRIRSGNLGAQREATAQGHRWRVEVEASSAQNGTPLDAHGGRIEQLESTVAELRESLALAREELRARRAEVHQLLALVNRFQA